MILNNSKSKSLLLTNTLQINQKIENGNLLYGFHFFVLGEKIPQEILITFEKGNLLFLYQNGYEEKLALNYHL